MPEPTGRTSSRGVRIMLVLLCAIALLATQLPPLVPPTFPRAHFPMWMVIAAVSGGLALLVTLRPTTRRSLLLSAGWLLVVVTVVQAFVVGDLGAMFCTFLAVPVLALLAGQLRPKPRKALVAAHAVAAACWIGVALTFVAMAVVAMSTNDIHTTRVTYELMAAFDITLLPWANFATFLTGIALGITTKWGLIRYYWVAAKIAVAVGILMMAFGFLHDSLERAGQEATVLVATGGTTAQLSSASDVVLWGFGCSTLGLVGALLLSLYKPGGRTRYSRRPSPPPLRHQVRRRPTEPAAHLTIARPPGSTPRCG
jgi:hypothetical protein